MRYMVYIWGFSYLHYLIDVLISRIRKLSLYNWFCLYFLYLMPHCLLVCVILTTLFFIHAFQFGFIDTHVLIYTCHLASSYHSLGSFWLPYTCMSRFWSLDWSIALRQRSSFSCGAGWLAAAPFIPDSPYRLARFSCSSWASICIIHIVDLTLAPPSDVICRNIMSHSVITCNCILFIGLYKHHVLPYFDFCLFQCLVYI